MSLDRVFNVASAIVGVALATTLVVSPNTSKVVDSIARGFTGSIRAAMGK